ncbi:hypothetical protein J1N35_037188 [Gossypium stocksii]|uniref:Retrovirus-related Pol polyprotein from transposon TNT 1-94 n=1 Tax=Gossypium stocksii TaxID=47602 RepID=A0A9D3UKB6_9ROSI|nr:hypothetical protein J1N35_037188 [Gossypium stocksii]
MQIVCLRRILNLIDLSNKITLLPRGSCHRRALHSHRMDDLSMKEFLMKFKGYCDNLASCGEVISKHEHVTAILNGLSPEYESIITVITKS